MKNITEEMGIHKEWYKEAREMKLENLQSFISRLLSDYNHDYGTICHAIASGAIATAYAMNKHEQGGITGFQAGAIMWKFVKGWLYQDNKTALRILDYDKILFPQYEDDFEKAIDKDTWEGIQLEATRRLAESPDAHPDVIKHWESIRLGVVPFGYKVEEDELQCQN